MSLGDQSGLTRTIEPVEDMIDSGLQKQLQTLFNCLVIPVQSVDAKPMAQKLAEMQGGLPDTFAFFQWQSIERNNDSYNSKARDLNGTLVVVPSARGEKAYRALVVAVINRYEIKLYTKSMKQVKTFTKRWLFSQNQGRAAFSVLYGGTEFPIRIQFDDTLTIPERTSDLTQEKQYELTGTFSVRSFISQEELLETEIVYDTEVLGVVSDLDDFEQCRTSEVSNAADEGRIFWSHKPRNSNRTE